MPIRENTAAASSCGVKTKNSRRIIDLYMRWYPVVNVFFVILMSIIVVVLVVVDVYRSNSVLLNLISSGEAKPKPEIVVGVASVLIGGAVAALIWAYNDTKNRFVWVHLARNEVDSVLLLIVEDLRERENTEGETLNINIPSNVDESFNMHSHLYIFLNFRAFNYLKLFFREMKVYSDLVLNKKSVSERQLERLKCGILYGVIAARILASNQNIHSILVSELYDDVKSANLLSAIECIQQVENYFEIS